MTSLVVKFSLLFFSFALTWSETTGNDDIDTATLVCENNNCDGSNADNDNNNNSNEVTYLSDEMPIVIIDYFDLVNGKNLRASIESAYGLSGLGILLISNVPNLKNKRQRLLKLSKVFANDLPSKYRNTLINEESFYSIGWSYGKEKLSKNMPDLRKGSFYANPVFDDPTNGNKELIENYPSFYYPNIWPNSKNNSNNIINEIGMNIDEFGIELKEAFMSLGGLIHRVGGMLSIVMDDYVSSVRKFTNYKKNTLSNAIQSPIPKGRLLYYFSENEFQNNNNKNNNNDNNDNNDNSETKSSVPSPSNNNDDSELNNNDREDSWCGWHNDHSALTGLALGMFFDKNGNIMESLENSVAGLHVKNRLNATYHLHFNNEESSKYLAFQIGETSQILSGGALYATPHSVRGPIEDKYNDVGRSSFAVFMQPRHNHHMNSPNNLNISQIQFDRNLPITVPSLKSRWNNDTFDTFGAFTERTLKTYY